jgi:dihydrofolate synthase / folylpolyglutamate synthase
MDAIRATAEKVRAPLVVWGEDYEAFEQRGRLLYQNAERLMDLPLPTLMGRHQVENAGTAIAAALQLRSLAITDTGVERGLIDVRWPARFGSTARTTSPAPRPSRRPWPSSRSEPPSPWASSSA